MRGRVIDLSVGYFGLQIAFGIQSASLSRVFQGLGASVDQLAILWLAGPVTGLLVQPVVGALSDRAPTRFGRRRPYILLSALVVIAALAALQLAASLVVAVAAVWMLEAAMNALHAPYRALVADTLPPDEHARGYAMQTVFIGLGALAGACAPILLAWGGWSNVALPGQTAPSIRVAFVAAAPWRCRWAGPWRGCRNPRPVARGMTKRGPRWAAKRKSPRCGMRCGPWR
ncbi:MFS transporter [Novosphingobium sp. B-7]|uniref:MFS transporter n=1 Tax=Novosphingobium sp. B-7 TaxID=1298855 RepID=UPI00130E5224|nr:MFS transporter [Novosphingobium sp. B-7]